MAELGVRTAKAAERGWAVSVEAATPAVRKEGGPEGVSWVTVEAVMATGQWVVMVAAVREDT